MLTSNLGKIGVREGARRVLEGALVKMLERQRVQQAAADAAKKLEDATKKAEETARAAAAQAAPDFYRVFIVS